MSVQKRQEDKGFPWGFLIGFIIIMGLVAYYMLKEPNKNFDNLNAFGGRQVELMIRMKIQFRYRVL